MDDIFLDSKRISVNIKTSLNMWITCPLTITDELAPNAKFEYLSY